MHATGSDPTTTAIELRRTLAAPRQRVFDAWTRAETLSRWFAPSEDFQMTVHQLDLRVGGRYRIEMAHNDGPRYIVTGIYREIAPPDRLVFTWLWEGNTELPETTVIIQLIERETGTELVLTHRRFANSTQRDEHLKGWTGCLERLPGVF